MTRLILLCTLGGLWLPSQVSAYFVESRTDDGMGNPVPLRYDLSMSPDVEFRVSSTGAPITDGSEITAIAAAFQTWSDVMCSDINFVAGPSEDTPVARHWTSSCPDPEMGPCEIYILVYWSDDMALFPDAAPGVGFTDFAFDGTDFMTMIGGQIILNSRHFMWSTDDAGEADRLDVQSVVTSLVGRVLGLTSNVEGNSTYGSYRPNDTSKRMLGDDEIAGLQFLYGPTSAPPPDGGFPDGGGPDAGATGCAMPTDPEVFCDGMPRPPGMECPPRPMTSGDAGVINPDGSTPGLDAGPSTGGDGGTTPGGGDDDGGCCSTAPGASSNDTPALAAALLLGLVLLRRRRRRGGVG